MRTLRFAGVLAGIAIVCTTTALAAEKGSMKVFDPTVVNGTQLSPGDYGLQWEGTGSNVQLKILQGKKVIATTSATLVQLNAPASQNMIATRNTDNHGRALSGVSFRGKNYALTIGDEPSQSDVAKK